MHTLAKQEQEQEQEQKTGPHRESNPGPLAPEARIIPLDHEAMPKRTRRQLFNHIKTTTNEQQTHTKSNHNIQSPHHDHHMLLGT
jgi:hypothetical protein